MRIQHNSSFAGYCGGPNCCAKLAMSLTTLSSVYTITTSEASGRGPSLRSDTRREDTVVAQTVAVQLMPGSIRQ